jgi:hypothetical protein
MMPPPTTSRRPGASTPSRASVLPQIRGSSGRPGSFTAWEPEAMMACSKARVRGSSPSTRSSWLAVKAPVPVITSTFRALAIEARPPVRVATTSSLRARMRSKSKAGSP